MKIAFIQLFFVIALYFCDGHFSEQLNANSCELVFVEQTVFNGNSSSQNLAFVHNNKLYLNLTNGIYRCNLDYTNPERLTYDCAFYPFVYENHLYYIENDKIHKTNLYTNVDEIIYESVANDGILELYLLNERIAFVEDKQIKTMSFDGEVISKANIDISYHASFANESLFFFVGSNNNTIWIYDFETNESTKILDTGNERLGENLVSDGTWVYYCTTTPTGLDLKRVNIEDGKTQIIIKDSFGAEFNISNNVCYYVDYKDYNLKKHDMVTNTREVLLGDEYDIHDINVVNERIVFRVTNKYKNLRIFDPVTKELFDTRTFGDTFSGV